ncbi:MAG: TonB-dependent receptor [Pseudarcicella sp.]|nr:TonB-dependent receptor [Pseudarcicella sp.]MBP6411401.1 TonB-dependent receptor [Pseudarcicella sp.]
MKLALKVFLFVLIATNILAQKTAINGTVKAILNNQPIEYANVSIWKDEKTPINGTVTNKDGFFKLENITEKKVTLKITFIGFETYSKEIELEKTTKNITLENVFLKENNKSLNEVTVKGEKNISSIQIDKQVFSAKQFQTAANGTALDLVQKTSSITLNNEGELSLRGKKGIVILINGVPSTRNPSDVLSQLPANIIEQIEIVTTPGAKYDADGDAGVINIITQKNVALGWSGIANIMSGGFDPLRYSGDITLEYSQPKYSFFVGADYRRYDILGYRIGEVRTIFEDILTYLPSVGERNYKDTQYALRSGLNYNLSKNDQLNLTLYTGKKQTDRFANLHYREFTNISNNLLENISNRVSEDFFNQNTFVRFGKFSTVSLDYAHTYSGKSKLTALALYDYSVLGGPLNNYDTFEGTEIVKLHEKTNENSPLTAIRIQADYSLPLKEKSKLDMGYSFRNFDQSGDFNFQQLNKATKQFENNLEFTDKQQMQQAIHAMYLQYGKEIKSVALNIGLRSEYMNRSLTHNQEKNKTYRYEKLHLFPSIQSLWTINNTHKLRLAYSRRIDRPVTKALSPFKNHRHAETIEMGDPELRPEISDVVELTVSKAFKNININATSYYTHVSDKVFRVNDVYSRTIVLRNYSNAGSAVSKGIELTAEVKVNKWWKFYVSGNLFNFDVKGEAFGKKTNNNSLNFNSIANTSIDILPNLRFQWDINYLGATATTQGNDSKLWISNAGLKYNFLKNKANLGLTLTNIFDSNRQHITTKSDDFYSTTEYIKYDRVLQFSFGYRFNEKTTKAKNNKSEYGEKEF